MDSKTVSFLSCTATQTCVIIFGIIFGFFSFTNSITVLKNEKYDGIITVFSIPVILTEIHYK